MNRDIPGFYYGQCFWSPRSLYTSYSGCVNETISILTNQLSTDAEKKKYFQIQANHVAPPGAQYSKDSVKRKRNDQVVSSPLPRARASVLILGRNTTNAFS